MVKNKKIKLEDYCKQRGTNINTLAKICDVSFNTLYYINRNAKFNCSVKTINKIYQGTLNAFGEGLRPEAYLDNPFFNIEQLNLSTDKEK